MRDSTGFGHAGHQSDLVEKERQILCRWEKLTRGQLKGQAAVAATEYFARIQKDNHESALQKMEDEGRSFKKRVFGIGPDNRLIPASKLVFPLSPFGIFWLVMTAILLAYTAIVTPPVIAFHWLDPPCVKVPTLEMDMFVDVFFALDIVLNFNMGRLGERSGGRAEYDDDRWSISRRYVEGYLLFDLVTSIPVSFVELSALQQCSGTGDQSTGSSDVGLRLVRALKPLRFMKVSLSTCAHSRACVWGGGCVRARVFVCVLVCVNIYTLCIHVVCGRIMQVLRLMKLGKLGRVVDMLSDFFNISPKAGQTLKVGTVLMSIIHILSCLWWLWKVVAGGEDGAVDFLQRQSWDAGESPAGLGSLPGKIEAYVMGCYLVTMTITTVGYGDISADNTAERVGYVVLFLFGAFVWGNLLAEVGEIHAASSAREAEKIQNVQAMLEFLMENDCPRVLRTRIVQYVRFAEEHHDNNVRKQVMIEKLPADLRTELLGHLFSPLMQRVPVFGFIRSSAGARTSDCFLAKVADITPDVMPLSAAVVARRQATAVGPRCVTGV